LPPAPDALIPPPLKTETVAPPPLEASPPLLEPAGDRLVSFDPQATSSSAIASTKPRELRGAVIPS
jgi:hypothetical protein